jgi:hypothetical protein
MAGRAILKNVQRQFKVPEAQRMLLPAMQADIPMLFILGHSTTSNMSVICHETSLATKNKKSRPKKNISNCRSRSTELVANAYVWSPDSGNVHQ